MAPACFGIVETPIRATGNWSSRVVAVSGTEPIPQPWPNLANHYPIPPGPTSGHSAATAPYLWPTFSQVYPAIPRLTNTAGTDIHPETTPVVPGTPTPQQVPYRGNVPRVGGGLGRVTVQPKPSTPWQNKVQGIINKARGNSG